jgi:glutamyl-tRNA synthetase
MTKEVRVRIAPSPTGDPHVGTAYIALFNWMYAHKHGGKFILRIEDTDQSRCSAESEAKIFESLKWLGLDYDEGPDVGGDYGPYRQSERLDIYKKYSDEMVAKGTAYPCFCTSQRLEELKLLQGKLKQSRGYDGHCRFMAKDEVEKRIEAGEAYVVRLKVDKEKQTRFKDWLRDEIMIENREVDDQVLLKTDGFPTYHLANVVDDHLMKITHVIRAEEWIVSVPKHLMIYEALGLEPPEFIHMPLLRNADKSKISKRKNPVDITWYRDEGFLPEALLNFLALLGWSFGDDKEIFSQEEMLQVFDINRVSITGPVFDREKLKWMNGMYIRELPLATLRDLLQKWMKDGEELSEDQLAGLLPLVQDRLLTLNQWDELTHYFAPTLIDYDLENLRVRKKNKATGREMHSPTEVSAVLKQLADKMSESANWEESALDDLNKAFLDSLETWKGAELFFLLRKVVTGTVKSPPLTATMAILGQDVCVRRLRDASEKLEDLTAESQAENG